MNDRDNGFRWREVFAIENKDGKIIEIVGTNTEAANRTQYLNNNTGVCICGHPAEHHDRDGFCCGNLNEFRAGGERGISTCNCHEFRPV